MEWAASIHANRRAFRHAAPRPGYQGLHECGLHDALDEGETAHAERLGQHGDEPAELVAKNVFHQRAVRSCVSGRSLLPKDVRPRRPHAGGSQIRGTVLRMGRPL